MPERVWHAPCGILQPVLQTSPVWGKRAGAGGGISWERGVILRSAGRGQCSQPVLVGISLADFQQQAPVAPWYTSTRRRSPSAAPWLPWHPPAPSSGIPCAKGRASPCAPRRANSHLTPPHCWDNKYLTPERSARPGCSPAPRRHVQGRQIGRLLEEANLMGWQAARLPWPPATAPASRRASLPDTSPRRVTGHWVVSHTRKDSRGLPHH